MARDWHPTKNDLLLPEYFTPGSGRVVWWRGRCRHIWQDSSNHRTSGRGCPKCRYKRTSEIWKKKNAKKNNPQLELDLK
ncbi:zinc-ribbon domain-containing protein [Halobacteriovorax sp. DPLXC-1]|uniref:zinc-ribbon domain-containing protein n=1 Tax=Halobacteriovorax sp. DPLXC-1 TaxID=3110771 RepID=UPI003FA5B4CD